MIEDYVFSLKTTRMPPTNTAINNILLSSLLKKNGIKYHIYSIKHTPVSYLIYKGIDIYVISKKLGH